jgi:hypothetical protein
MKIVIDNLELENCGQTINITVKGYSANGDSLELQEIVDIEELLVAITALNTLIQEEDKS